MTNKKQSPRPRQEVEANLTNSLQLLLKDEALCIKLHTVWPDLEKILLAIQRGHSSLEISPESRLAVCSGMDQIINTLELFNEQGRMDKENLAK